VLAGVTVSCGAFILERHPVRGFWIRLDGAWREMRRHQRYPPWWRHYWRSGHGVAAACGDAQIPRHAELQLAGDGLVNLLVAQCTHEFVIRAVARFDDASMGR